MATIEQLEAALVQADAAGNAADAQALADEIRRVRAATIGTEKGAKGPAQRLEILRAQIADPARNVAFDSELRGEIARLEKATPDATPTVYPPQPAQADVRKSEQPLAPLPAQELEERRFDAARKQWMAATGGALKPGQTQSQAIAEFSGIRDPRETRADAEVQHMAETGEYVPDDSVAYEAAKTLASLAGFSLGGPAGATAAEMATRAISLKARLDAAKKNGLPQDEYDRIFAYELSTGVGADVAFNFGVPVIGNWISKLVGSSTGTAVKNALQRTFGDDAAMRAAKVAKRADPRSRVGKIVGAENPVTPAQQEAVRELSVRTKGDYVPTPGQVSGEAPAIEAAARKANPRDFIKQEKALQDAAEQMRQEAFYPGGQPVRQKLGERIVQIADDVVKATKDRLRPAFEAADNIGIQIDMSGVAARAKAALASDATVPGGKLAPRERADLESLLGSVPVSAEAALDFISRQKEKLRATADYTPSSYYEKIVTGLMKDADAAYVAAVKNVAAKQRTTGDILAANRQTESAGKSYAQSAGTEKVLTDLLAARKDYRKMMETVFDDAMKQALRKEAGGAPEDIGSYLYQNGKVSRLEQLDELLGLAQKEGKLTPARAEKLRRDVTRGFLQEHAKSIDAVAGWSQTLAQQPRLKETWDVLTKTPDGQKLKRTMEVLEEAAKMSIRDNATLAGAPLLLNPGAAESFARRGSTGALQPGYLLTAISYTGLTKAAATAYTHGHKGVFNWIATIARLHNVKTGAAAKAVQEASGKLKAWAQENGVTLGGDEEEPE